MAAKPVIPGIDFVTAHGDGSATGARIMCLYRNNGTVGHAKFQGFKRTGAGCEVAVGIVQRCIPVMNNGVACELMQGVTSESGNDGVCIQTFDCVSGDDCGEWGTCTTWNSVYTSYFWSIPVRAKNDTIPPTLTSLALDMAGTTAMLTWSWVTDPTGGEVFAYRLRITKISDGTTRYMWLAPSDITGSISSLRRIEVGNLEVGVDFRFAVSAMSHNEYESEPFTKDGSTRNYHYDCVAGVCTRLETTGYDGCNLTDNPCPTFHYECEAGKCVKKDGTGKSTCLLDSECAGRCGLIDLGCIFENAFGIPSWVFYVIIALIIIFIIMSYVK